MIIEFKKCESTYKAVTEQEEKTCKFCGTPIRILDPFINQNKNSAEDSRLSAHKSENKLGWLGWSGKIGSFIGFILVLAIVKTCTKTITKSALSSNKQSTSESSLFDESSKRILKKWQQDSRFLKRLEKMTPEERKHGIEILRQSGVSKLDRQNFDLWLKIVERRFELFYGVCVMAWKGKLPSGHSMPTMKDAEKSFSKNETVILWKLLDATIEAELSGITINPRQEAFQRGLAQIIEKMSQKNQIRANMLLGQDANIISDTDACWMSKNLLEIDLVSPELQLEYLRYLASILK